MSAIDPRLRQRRIAVRRAEGRRRLRILVGALILAAAVAGGYALTRSPVFDLDEVAVEGAFGSEADEVRAASQLELGTPLLDLELETATAEVTALPWVRTATVERSWFGTATITVERRLPVALLPTGDGGGVVVDEDGVAIARTETSAGGDLPVITVAAVGSLGDVQPLVLPVIEVIKLVPSDLEPWIETYGVRFDGTETAQLRLDLIGSAVAELGEPRILDEKLDALRTVLGRVDLTCLSVIRLQVSELANTLRDETCLGVTEPPVEETP